MVTQAVTQAEVETIALQTLLSYWITVPIPFGASGRTNVDAYVQIERHNQNVGRVMGKNDFWIAATAHVTGARLMTADSDFDHLAGIFLDLEKIDPHTL